MKKHVVFGLLMAVMAVGAKAETQFVVSPNGSDSGSGSSWRPFATLTRARDAVRAARVKHPNEAFTVLLKDGIYPLTNSLELTEADSGTPAAPVTYRAANHGGARVIGGLVLTLKDFGPCTNVTLLSRIRPEIRGHVRACNLSARLRNHYGPVPKDFSGVIPLPYLCGDGELKPLARWPNEGWAHFTNIVDSGRAPKDPQHPLAPRENHPGAFVMETGRAANWRIDEGVWLRGYWCQDWAEQVIQIASYDPEKRVVRLASPHTYGLGSGWGASQKRPYYALNVLEELDAPGEWFFDRQTNVLLYYPDPAKPDRELVLATLRTPLVLAKQVHDVVFKDIRFCDSHGDGLRILNGANVLIEKCQIDCVAESGIRLDGRICIVRSCDIFNIGATGISVSGGDRKDLIKAGNVIEDNDIMRFGRFRRTYCGAVAVAGCGQVVRNNHFHDGPHLAVLYHGNEQLIELNEVDNVLQESGDSGAFYTGRDWTSQGNIIRHNYFHDLGGKRGQTPYIMGVYLDDCDSGDTLDGNLFLRAGNAIFVGGGRDNTFVNNLTLDCITSFSLDSRGMTWPNWNQKDGDWWLEGKAMEMGYTHAPWSTRYPRLAATMQNSPREPLGNVISNNVFIDSREGATCFDSNVRKLFFKLACQNNVLVDTAGTNVLATRCYDLDGFETALPSTPAYPIVLGLPHNGQALRSIKDSAWIMRAMPSLASIPVEKIGLLRKKE